MTGLRDRAELLRSGVWGRTLAWLQLLHVCMVIKVPHVLSRLMRVSAVFLMTRRPRPPIAHINQTKPTPQLQRLQCDLFQAASHRDTKTRSSAPRPYGLTVLKSVTLAASWSPPPPASQRHHGTIELSKLTSSHTAFTKLGASARVPMSILFRYKTEAEAVARWATQIPHVQQAGDGLR
jgi:hypothetical protein